MGESTGCRYGALACKSRTFTGRRLLNYVLNSVSKTKYTAGRMPSTTEKESVFVRLPCCNGR